jgi:uncharacterized protein (DUF488 family)
MPGEPIYTIGYGARQVEELIAALQAHQIQYLMDVRSKPYSSYKPEFSKHALQSFLESHGVGYLFMGDSLGGQPDDETCYTDGKVDYVKLARKSFYLEGIEHLKKASRQEQRVALMCSEGKPENCHRSKLIGQSLSSEGIEVLHIDEQDAVLSQKQVLLRLSGGQPSLFGDNFFTYTSRKRYQGETADDLDES